METFFFRYFSPTDNDMEVSSPVYDLVEHIQKVDISLLRLFVLTDGVHKRTEDKSKKELRYRHIFGTLKISQKF